MINLDVFNLLALSRLYILQMYVVSKSHKNDMKKSHDCVNVFTFTEILTKNTFSKKSINV